MIFIRAAYHHVFQTYVLFILHNATSDLLLSRLPTTSISCSESDSKPEFALPVESFFCLLSFSDSSGSHLINGSTWDSLLVLESASFPRKTKKVQ
jgi:hypothetical protein